MTTDPEKPNTSADATARWRQWCSNGYEHVLLLALALWVVRVPVVTTLLGLVILDTLPQAQDMFVDLNQLNAQLLFSPLLLFMWALPTYYAAAELLESDARFQKYAKGYRNFFDKMELWIPRVLGILIFVALTICIWKSYHITPPITDPNADLNLAQRELLSHAVMLLLAAGAFAACILKFPRLADIYRQRLIQRFVQRVLPGSRWLTLLLVIFFGILAVLIIFPVRVAEWFPRGQSIPFILGGWVPFLSYLGSIGRRLRFPVIGALGALVVALNSFLGDDHPVRLINAAETVGHSVDIAPMPLQQAVDLWRTENNCGPPAAPATCPRPIVIAAAGGASRAGFFTATVIGKLMSEAQTHGLDPNKVRNRLFAISSVSGGSMGAVMVTAALAAKTDSTDQPCVQSGMPLWWGSKIANWRDCLEVLTSGDFLTPVIVGLTFHDAFSFLLTRDRAAVLENSWQRRYTDVLTPADPPAQSSNCEGLDCPLQTLRPRSGHWIPLLILNGTSEKTGGRIVTTPLAAQYATANGKCTGGCEVFPGARNFYELLSAENKAQSAFDDVRISTAALNSARFPIISPPGAVRNPANDVVDRVVDGGYFDNYGITSATDLVEALHAVRPELAPTVIVITNDPSDEHFSADGATSTVDSPAAKKQGPLGNQPVSEFLPDLVAPITTIMNNRNLRGVITYGQSSKELNNLDPHCDSKSIHVAVWITPISLSWWLSTVDQLSLRDQTEGTGENNPNAQQLENIWKVLGATSDRVLKKTETQ